MNLEKAISSQFYAALEMLKQTVERCPDASWNLAEDKVKVWKIAYHALFFTHLYLQRTVNDFHPWEKHRENGQDLADPGTDEQPYSKAEILEYLAICQMQVDENIAQLDPGAPSGFDWLPFSKLELHLYNIRHLQQHIGELMERLGRQSGLEFPWVARKPQ